jgi:hypothetical protein
LHIANRAGLEKFKLIHRPEPTQSIGILELLGEPDDSQLQAVWKQWESNLVPPLSALGVEGVEIKALLRGMLGNGQSAPSKVWALMPGQITIR